MNDCTAGPAGRLLAGSLFSDPNKDYPRGHLVQVDTDGTARVVDEGSHLANGVCFSPDCGTLCTDSAARRIYAYGSGGDRFLFAITGMSKRPRSDGVPGGVHSGK
jgi:sugar lactone lactonase YvrE